MGIIVIILPVIVASNGTLVPDALLNRNSIKASTFVFVMALLSINRTASLKLIVGLVVVAIFTAALAGTIVAVGGDVSPPPKVVPSKVKLSKRLFPTVPPAPCANSTFNLKFALLFAPVIEDKSKVVNAGLASLIVTDVKTT